MSDLKPFMICVTHATFIFRKDTIISNRNDRQLNNQTDNNYFPRRILIVYSSILLIF